MRNYKNMLTVFTVGAVLYTTIEILWRGFTHWSMAVAGGICMCGIYCVNDKMAKKKKIDKCAVCTLIITIVEFTFGVILNKMLHMHVWDYSRFKFNILGQICLLYSFFWFILSFPALRLCDYIKKNLLR